jgi:hypothetical protein
MDPNRNDPPKKPDGDDKKPKSLWTTIFISIAILVAFISIYNFINNSKYTETTYTDFVDAMNASNLAEVEFNSMIWELRNRGFTGIIHDTIHGGDYNLQKTDWNHE